MHRDTASYYITEACDQGGPSGMHELVVHAVWRILHTLQVSCLVGLMRFTSK